MAARPPQERGLVTRAALLDAALECLVEKGYVATTTTEVAMRAGVSRGAQLHHFPTKDALLTAAVGHLLERRTAEFRKAFADAEPGANRLDIAIDLMWSMYQGPTFVAWAELWMAARTDAGLRDSMVEVNRRFIEECEANFAEVLPPVPGVEQDFYELALAFATAVMDGLAFFRLVAPDSGVPAPRIIDALKVVAQLTAPTEQIAPSEEEP